MNHSIEFARAVNNGDLRTVKIMVKDGYQVRKDSGIYFYTAIKKGYLAVVKFLIEQNISYNIRNIFREASVNGQTDILKYLFKKVGPVNEKHVIDILMTACCNGYLDIIKFLEKKVDLRSGDDKALYLAAYFNKMEIFQYLLSKGLNIKTEKYKAFKGSLKSHQDEISQFIIKRQDDLKTINKFLMFSAKAGKLDNVKILIAKGGDIRIAKKFGNQPILDHCTGIFFNNLQETISSKEEKKEKIVKI